ncbi:TPA: exoribonuclease II [Haemophilus influenzae]|uniref:Exoribonuclease 2 n=5 Tax=Bacteria TaxID=2 RepID=RNB_HAEI8|nr:MULTISPECIES: exoribonuclease II [Haemophilus]Q4QJL5.1 RecName: Full=Exoribonuclease 2; AltName: Full=Exoribonuclease II; Short=RNase II; Short=Ribonuclease II [Haemophilus influenzae 86-028NP]AAX88782.1 exoribonuclease II [Haemophilus influenzae 86-028NP]AIT67677.1 exoribonuclease II [Haemophilus influenzae]AJO89760.1 Exoribonuclease 2 [Haemophilus influenzae]AJO92119.1 Exoribonuclease 2 [Haemophilus influenzae]AVI96867.1 exoribonuclease II [Haemophilus influenzae]
MFQDNPLLAQLKQQIHDSKEQVEGVVKSTDKAYGFLECDKKTYFIAPPSMKKVMHGDKIKATIEKQGDKEQAEPEALIEPMLTRFIAKVRFNKDKKLQVLVDHPSINQPIGAQQAKSVKEELQEGDWVVANLKTHPLRDDRFFYATINQFICRADDELAPWWVTLARHEQSRYPVQGAEHYEMLDQKTRENLTALHFVTIDSESTMDMDDALYIEPIAQNSTQTGWKLVVAIADPTAYIALDSQIEQEAKQRCFTNYLPGFNIPMLPRELSDELCSLIANETRPALVCYIETDLAGNITAKPHFVSAYVQSKAKLAYNKVSDYLEQADNAWQPETPETAQQIHWLHQFTKARIQWHKTHSLLFKEKPDYAFVLAENGKVQEIKAEYRRIANQIVEEAMIIANICAAQFLHEQAKTGIFNTHSGFDKKFLENAHHFLMANLANEQNQTELAERYSVENLATLNGYCQMRHDIEPIESDYLELRLRRYLTFAEFKSELAPHFGLGLEGYATWTSPIRKYSDMVNHRLIKAVLAKQPYEKTQNDVLARLQEARRQNRLVERDIADWLYCRYLAPKVAENVEFNAEVQDVMRGGLRVQLLENGASMFIPASTLHNNKEEMQVNSDEIALYIKGERTYKIGDIVKVKLTEVKEATRSIVGEILQ